ncbi:MAG TPA: hypothetical protein VFM46_12665, partial [Pseudomonadales bacterium]|nr:hypothetical protein [Pseudomonadales bacterium]
MTAVEQRNSCFHAAWRNFLRLTCACICLFAVALPSWADIAASGPVQSPLDPVLDQSGSVTVTYTFTLAVTGQSSSAILDFYQASDLQTPVSNFTLVPTGSVCAQDGPIYCYDLPVG